MSLEPRGSSTSWERLPVKEWGLETFIKELHVPLEPIWVGDRRSWCMVQERRSSQEWLSSRVGCQHCRTHLLGGWNKRMQWDLLRCDLSGWQGVLRTRNIGVSLALPLSSFSKWSNTEEEYSSNTAGVKDRAVDMFRAAASPSQLHSCLHLPRLLSLCRSSVNFTSPPKSFSRTV